jgi:tetratricopeptide (TPR) repeat protein
MRTAAIVAMMLVAVSARSETAEQFFDQANQAYQQGKFSEAIEKYEMILETGLVSGELYYNLGNAYYKAGKLGKAILNYERALRLLPGDEDILHNLQLANLMLTDRIEPTPRLFLWDWWDNVKGAFSLRGITWIGYLFFLLLLSSVAAIMLAPTYALRRMAFAVTLGSALLLVVSLVIFFGKLNDVQRSDVAIVTANITTVKNSPDPKSTDAFVLHTGVKVFITDKVNDWLKIRLADGKVGWMEQGACEVI